MTCGKIIVAEDQLIIMQILKQHFKDLGLIEYCEFCTDGQMAINTVKRLIDEAVIEENVVDSNPISIMLVDFQMPLKNGMEVIEFTNQKIN